MSANDPKRTWGWLPTTPSNVPVLAGTMVDPSVGGDNAAARLHHTYGWRSGNVASDDVCATVKKLLESFSTASPESQAKESEAPLPAALICRGIGPLLCR